MNKETEKHSKAVYYKKTLQYAIGNQIEIYRECIYIPNKQVVVYKQPAFNDLNYSYNKSTEILNEGKKIFKGDFSNVQNINRKSIKHIEIENNFIEQIINNISTSMIKQKNAGFSIDHIINTIKLSK